MVSLKQGYGYDDLFDEDDRPMATAQTVIDRLNSTGIDPELLAAHVGKALTKLFSEPVNATQLVKHNAELLWSILGDPKEGGADPPPIYKKAGFATHLAFIGLLSMLIDD